MDLNAGAIYEDRFHRGVGGLKADEAARFPIESLESGFRTIHQGDDNIAWVRLSGLFDQDEIAAADVVINHGFAADLQRVGVALARKIRELESLPTFDGFDGMSGGNPASQWNASKLLGLLRLHRPTTLLKVFRSDFEGTALVEGAAQVSAGFERLNVFVNRRHGGEVQASGEFFITGAVAVVFDKARDEIQDLFLPSCDRHGFIMGE